MHVQSLSSFLALVASLSVATAHAESPTADAPPPDRPAPRSWFGLNGKPACARDEPGDWSLGTSLTFGGSLGALSLVGGLGALGGVAEVAVEPGVALERRLDDHWWLTLGGSFTYQDADNGTRSLGATGSLGARFVIQPGARIRVAPRASIYGRGGSSDYAVTIEGETTTLSYDTRHFGVALGLDVELVVVDGFALRLDVTLASADWSTSDRDDGTNTDSTDGFGIALLTRPTLSAVFTF